MGKRSPNDANGVNRGLDEGAAVTTKKARYEHESQNSGSVTSSVAFTSNGVLPSDCEVQSSSDAQSGTAVLTDQGVVSTTSDEDAHSSVLSNCYGDDSGIMSRTTSGSASLTSDDGETQSAHGTVADSNTFMRINSGGTAAGAHQCEKQLRIAAIAEAKARGTRKVTQREQTLIDRTKAQLLKYNNAAAAGTLANSVQDWNVNKRQSQQPVRTKCNDVVLWQCVHCRQEKPLTPEHFTLRNGGKTLFQTCAAGHESYLNSSTRPCNTCFARMRASEREELDGRVFNILQKYPREFDRSWYVEQWRRQGGDISVDSASGKLLAIVSQCTCNGFRGTVFLSGKGQYHDFSATISSSVCRPATEHCAAECTLECCEYNVTQHKDIPSLPLAWSALIRDSIACIALSLTPAGAARLASEESEMHTKCIKNLSNRKNKAKNGVIGHRDAKERDSLNRDLDLATICTCLARDCNRADRKAAAQGIRAHNPSPIKAADVEELWLSSVRCPISRVLMTIERGPRRGSVDRINKGFHAVHSRSQVRIICRILNCSAGWTPNKWAWLLLNQGLVPVPQDVREHLAPSAVAYLADKHVT